MFKYGAYADNYPNEAKDENAQPCCCAHPGLKALEALHENLIDQYVFSLPKNGKGRPAAFIDCSGRP
jgi:hypothetical protein